jgi:hypothetical protein
MAERRYDDAESAAIFKVAAELQQATAREATGGRPVLGQGEGETDGMTLAQLQDIAREVGIPSELIARAAEGLSRRGRVTVRRFLGLPIGVGRSISLDHRLTDEQWERLVVDLRETFDARGRLHDEGNFRQWTNGNLQALLEPTAGGHQLRLRTLKADAFSAMTLGLATTGFGGVLYAALLAAGRENRAGVGLVMAAAGLAMFAFGALRVPAWARLRQKQMEDIIARLTDRALPPSDDSQR